MALPDITQRLKLQAEGVKETEASSANIHKNLVGAAQAAEALARAQAANARKATLKTTQENLEYGQMRGTAGATGAASRDFAEQSRGLGGLVRLYATFAANIFAVSAAFNVLRNAMDTSNMIAGLNALGAESGRSLGTLSKQLVNITDGAISLREAMSATAMASSAGLTNQQIIKLGQVAKTTSLALGINMPDAINRLSRGITKLEPELLDELGIFTKIEPATQAYALQLGKAASQLTDFERRQAFANAVLKEGEEKFKALETAAANPYDKLLAGLKDVAFQGLELLNKVLTPIVKILAESPGALAAGLVAVIGLLVRQAIPAITEIRAGLAAGADKALQTAKGKAGDVLRAREQLNRLIERDVEASADKELKVLEQKEARINELKSQGYKFSKQLTEALKKDITDLTEQEIKAAKAQAQRLQTRAATSTDSNFKARAQAEMDTVKALEAHYQAEESLTAVKIRNREEITKTVQESRQYQNLQAEVVKLEEAATKKAILSNMAYNTSLVGIRNAWKLMRDEIENSSLKLNLFSGAVLNLRGAFAGLVGIISTLGAAINKAFFIITTFIAVVEVLDSFFSKNEKQAKAFNTAIDNANTSVENAKRTIENFNSKTSLEKDSIKSVNAMSTAFNELSLSIENTIVKAEDSKKAMSGFDKKIDWIKDLFGFGTEDKLAKSLTEQLTAGLNLAAKTGKSEEFKSKFQALLNVEDLYDADKVEAAIRKLDEKGRKAFIELISGVNSSVQKANSILQSFQSTTDKAAKTFQEFIQSTASKDPLFLFSESLLNASYAMQDLANAPAEDIIRGVQDLTQNTQKLVLYSNEFSDSIISMKSSFEAQKSYLNDNTLEIEKFNEGLRSTVTQTMRLSDAQERLKVAQENLARVRTTGDREARRQAALDLKAAEAAATNASYQRTGVSGIAPGGDLGLLNQAGGIGAAGAQVLATSVDLFRKEAANLLVRSQELANKAISNAQIQAGITMARAFSQVLTGPRAVAVETEASKREIQLRIEQVKNSLDLLNTQDRLTSAVENQTAATLANTEQLKPAGERNQTILQNAQISSEAIQAFKEFIDKAGKMPAGNITAAGQAFAAERNLSPQALEQFNQRVSAFALRRQQQQASLIGLNAEMRATEFTGQVKSGAAVLADRKELQQIETAITQIQSNRISLIQQMSGLNTQELIDKKTALEYEIQATKNNQEIEELERKIGNAKTASLSKDKDVAAEGAKELKRLENQIMPATIRRQIAEATAISERKIAEELQLQLEKIRKNAEIEKSNRDLINAKEEARLDIQRAQFTSAAELYNIDKKFIVNKTAELDAERVNFETVKQRVEIEANLGTKRQETEARVNSLKLEGADLTKKMAEEQQKLTDAANNQLAVLETERQKRLEILDIQKQQALKQAEISYRTEQAGKLADALGAAFGNAGTKLGSMVTTIIDSNIKQQQGQEALKKIRQDILAVDQKIATFSGSEEEIGFINERNQLLDAEGKKKKETRDNELLGNAKLLGSAKTLFKQHTTAYKTLAGLEKAYHIMRMVNMGVEMAMTLKKTATEITSKASGELAQTMLTVNGMLSRMPFMIGEIYGKTIGQLGIFGPPVAAALVALAYGRFGGSGSSSTVGLTAEDMNKVAGTGQQYQNGELVNRSGGVLGDPTAVADSIKSSIEMLSKNFFDLLGSGNSAIVKSLKAVELNTGETVKALIGEVSGFAGVNQSAFGTKTGSTSSFNIWWGGGKSTSTEIMSAGIEVIGSIGDILNNTANATLNTFENVKRTVKSKFLNITYDTDVYLDKNSERLNTRVITGIKNIFGSISNVLTESAKVLEGSSDRAQMIIDNFAVGLTVNLKDLSGQEAVDKFLGELSITLNNLTATIYPWVEEFRQIGEEAWETGARLAKGTEVVGDALELLGKSPLNFTKAYDRIKFEQVLINAAGGLEEFASQISYFTDNFLTEEEKLRPTALRLNTALFKLSAEFSNSEVAALDNKEEFKRLVQSLDLNVPASRALFSELMALAPAFDKVYSKVDEIVTTLEKETADLTSNLSPLEKALASIDEKASDYIKSLGSLNALTSKNVVTLGKWIQASRLKELEAEFKSLYDSRRKEAETLLNTWTQTSDKLSSLITNLTLGALSPLSPQKKLEESRRIYDETVADLTSTNTEKQLKAFQTFETVSNQYLSAAREVFASGEGYTSIFNTVLTDSKNAKSLAELQIEKANNMIAYMDTQAQTLGFINTNTIAVSTNLLEGFSSLIETINTTKADPVANAKALLRQQYGQDTYLAMDFATTGDRDYYASFDTNKDYRVSGTELDKFLAKHDNQGKGILITDSNRSLLEPYDYILKNGYIDSRELDNYLNGISYEAWLRAVQSGPSAPPIPQTTPPIINTSGTTSTSSGSGSGGNSSQTITVLEAKLDQLIAVQINQTNAVVNGLNGVRNGVEGVTFGTVVEASAGGDLVVSTVKSSTG